MTAKTRNRTVTAVLAGLLPAIVVAPSSKAEALAYGCPAFPFVSWRKLDHTMTVTYVNDQYKGNWTAYIDTWIGHRQKMQEIYDSNSTAIIPNLGYTLDSAQLAEYIRRIDARIGATQCLAQGAAIAAVSNTNKAIN